MHLSRGSGLLEIVIGAAIIGTAIVALLASFTAYFRYALLYEKNLQVAYLIEEGFEVMSFLRDADWEVNIAAHSPDIFFLEWTGTEWAITDTANYIDNLFLRSVFISNVYRNVSGKISESGTDDPYTKKITVDVSYANGSTAVVKSVSTYITK